jgi:hypothetical protein
MFKVQTILTAQGTKGKAWRDFNVSPSYFPNESDAWQFVANLDEDGIADRRTYRVIEGESTRRHF